MVLPTFPSILYQSMAMSGLFALCCVTPGKAFSQDIATQLFSRSELNFICEQCQQRREAWLTQNNRKTTFSNTQSFRDGSNFQSSGEIRCFANAANSKVVLISYDPPVDERSGPTRAAGINSDYAFYLTMSASNIWNLVELKQNVDFKEIADVSEKSLRSGGDEGFERLLNKSLGRCQSLAVGTLPLEFLLMLILNDPQSTVESKETDDPTLGRVLELQFTAVSGRGEPKESTLQGSISLLKDHNFHTLVGNWTSRGGTMKAEHSFKNQYEIVSNQAVITSATASVNNNLYSLESENSYSVMTDSETNELKGKIRLTGFGLPEPRIQNGYLRSALIFAIVGAAIFLVSFFIFRKRPIVR